MEPLADFVKHQLVDYIHKEIRRGYSLEEIAKVLSARGHRLDIVNAAIQDLEKHDFELAKLEPADDTLRSRFYRRVLECLVNYITFYKKKGFTFEKIKQALLDYGHTEKTIEEALAMVRSSGKKREEHFRMVVVSIALVSLVVFLILLTLLTREPTPRILAGMLPLLVAVLLAVTTLPRKTKDLLWYAPFLLCLGFFLIGRTGQVGVLKFMDLGVLSILNLVLSYAYLFILLQPMPDDWDKK